ncbi:MAG: hypothetical protein HN353_03075 [Bdellovibrionales bacterium]|jgi:hypothetical protein|nr:hypothetical protein [Bdellovibrionales bacterium]MBT3527111.1 hypothetical protein [Bdellovibrionales bacterium]MBT7669500.1 hypothetical protein [Bdellovibrionales bacterium]MBT7767118.1 hypothetical protein [Bdellovibrionales bacterium]
MNFLIKMVIFSCLLFLQVTQVTAQDLTAERIRRISGRKRAIFLHQGIFHNGDVKQDSSIMGIRRSYRKGTQQERLVFDFSSVKAPRIYGHINSKGKRINIDFFDTQIGNRVTQELRRGHFVDTINFYAVDKEVLSCELSFNTEVKVDIFYLESHGRLVVDIKKL